MTIELTDTRYERSLVAAGHSGRTGVLCGLPDRNKRLVYGAIGGSITQGASANPHENCYVDRFAAWLDRKCPAGCALVNAGIGASNSLFGTYRAGRDLLSHKPDLITIEYAVNDSNNPETDAAYESLVRQCLAAENRPTVILLFTMNSAGVNYQAQHIAVGNHYELPMLSYRDALYPDVEEGLLTWQDISPDTVHPNNDGHGFIAAMLARFADEAIAGRKTAPWPAMPAHLHGKSRLLEGGSIVDGAQMRIRSNTGWTTGEHKGGYTGLQADSPGAELEIEFTGKMAYIGYQKKAGGLGRVEAVLDEGAPVTLDGFFERPDIKAWAGGHTVLDRLLESPESERHVLRLKLLEEKHPDSDGHFFDIGYLLIS